MSKFEDFYMKMVVLVQVSLSHSWGVLNQTVLATVILWQRKKASQPKCTRHHPPASRLGHTCSRKLASLQYRRCILEGGSAIASLLMDVDGDLQVDHYCTKFLERMGLSREVSYPSMPNTAHGLKASIKKLFHNTKIKW